MAVKKKNRQIKKKQAFAINYDYETNSPVSAFTSPDPNKFPRSKAEFEAIKDGLRELYTRRGFDDGHLSAREEAKKQQKYLPRDDQRVITLMIAIEKIAEAQTQLAITASGVIKYMTGMDR